MDRFSGKRVRIAPKTAMSIAFKDYLLKNITCTFEGFIDKVKEDADVVRMESIDPDTVDAIIILSPNHFHKIYEEYCTRIPPSKLYLVHIKDKTYSLTQSIEPLRESAIERYSKHYDESGTKRTGTVFISKGFIGGNNKYLYLYCIRNNITAVMITDNIEQLQELRSHGLPCADLTTPAGERLIAEAKTLIFDQGNYTYFYISPNQTTFQLWHGVGLKKMAPHTHITYDYFVSTSTWTNETNFKHIFKAKQFLDYGYPRNDFLLQKDDDPLALLFCDRDIYDAVRNQTYTKTILYMPTTREYIFTDSAAHCDEPLLPLDFKLLNETLCSLNMLFIVKLHPFVMEQLGNTLQQENLSHIVFYPPQSDVYPILKHSDILISDYSSVIYDFLLLDRPIILFNYDKKQYEHTMENFLFDYDRYTPGIEIENGSDLIDLLRHSIENVSLSRRQCALKRLFLSSKRQSSSELLSQLLISGDTQ
ncbi:MAG: CDP-glycerol glycerophosphotransferase family protein [Sulfuricurvum sp.]|uniref:CDP-glycerol glycerophosphotransferase family protein n=1 Tax=Sulfuricurvum sp. TaxID=2025608 RepID=UPI00356A4CD8